MNKSLGMIISITILSLSAYADSDTIYHKVHVDGPGGGYNVCEGNGAGITFDAPMHNCASSESGGRSEAQVSVSPYAEKVILPEAFGPLSKAQLAVVNYLTDRRDPSLPTEFKCTTGFRSLNTTDIKDVLKNLNHLNVRIYKEKFFKTCHVDEAMKAATTGSAGGRPQADLIVKALQ